MAGLKYGIFPAYLSLDYRLEDLFKSKFNDDHDDQDIEKASKRVAAKLTFIENQFSVRKSKHHQAGTCWSAFVSKSLVLPKYLYPIEMEALHDLHVVTVVAVAVAVAVVVFVVYTILWCSCCRLISLLYNLL
uniref:Uncharacterized protein n=1 Tax=Glossina austeni TaxID=7395 RepID=A0A1A9UHJ4_GLOAU